jgi:hypothetical protein
MAEVYQQTIDILQGPNDPIFDKPKLAEKYLSKPPFRFLHDVISAVSPYMNSGFANSQHVNERSGKLVCARSCDSWLSEMLCLCRYKQARDLQQGFTLGWS